MHPMVEDPYEDLPLDFDFENIGVLTVPKSVPSNQQHAEFVMKWLNNQDKEVAKKVNKIK